MAYPPYKGSHSVPLVDGEFLDDLASRFIINVPVEERSNLIRICFQVELAHWFYLDFFCATEDDLVPCGIKQFAVHLFKHVPFLQPHVPDLEGIMEEWKKYKLSVPTYGAILVSADLSNVLLVQSFWAKSSWGFPKGKVNENEDPVHCAVREVFEETGFDPSDLISPTDYFESIFNYQFSRLYVVEGVPMDTVFIPRTRNEIKSCKWFPIDMLPNNKLDMECKANLGMNAHSFYMVMPFIKKLKKWISMRREQRRLHKMSKSDSKAIQNKRQRHKSMGDIENLWQGGPNPSASSYTPGPSDYHIPSTSSGGKAMTVAKCGGGDTPMNRFSTPIDAKRVRDKVNKPNIKRQLFGPDVASTSSLAALDHGPASPSAFNFSFTNFEVKPQNYLGGSGGAKPKNLSTCQLTEMDEGEEEGLTIEEMNIVPFKEWDEFQFDMAKLAACLGELL